MGKWAGSILTPTKERAETAKFGAALVVPPGAGFVCPQRWFASSVAPAVVVFAHVLGSRSVLVVVLRVLRLFWSFRVRGGFVCPCRWCAFGVGFGAFVAVLQRLFYSGSAHRGR